MSLGWRWLPPLLSIIAGLVDVIGFLSLGRLFTAHVTGNLVVISALLVRGGPPNMAQVLAVPVFVGVVALVGLLAKASGRRGTSLVRPLLLVQCVLLICVLLVCVTEASTGQSRPLEISIAAMLAVAAMACQFTLLRLAVTGTPSTAVMTGNVTNAVLSLLDVLVPGDQPTDDARDRLGRTLLLIGGFLVGCVIGAAGVSLLGSWAWALPVILAAMAIALS